MLRFCFGRGRGYRRIARLDIRGGNGRNVRNFWKIGLSWHVDSFDATMVHICKDKCKVCWCVCH